MNIYTQKQRWKLLLLVAALLIGAASLWYTNKLVNKLSEEEYKRIQLWAEATRRLADVTEMNTDINFLSSVISNNNSIPVIWADEEFKVISYRNLDSLKALDSTYLNRQALIMRTEHDPIEIRIGQNLKQYILYRDSDLLIRLRYYPYFQLGVIALFLFVSYLAFSSSRKAEQNQVWVGMAKETAHQLGTPLSSLLAWLEFLKIKGTSSEYTNEIEKDIQRLQTITDRFSKIGSAPSLKKENVRTVMQHSIDYIRTRSSDKVTFSLEAPAYDIQAPMNVPLFEWVVENILKNALDAMEGNGRILVMITDQQQFVYIDISDTGKGVPKSSYKTIFKPGFTTKNRGWGLGLSLSKRIIEEYHDGQIFVKSSEIGKGTTFRIVLKK
ncbi:MAG: sensor histidine kinase [Bacteroidota bacterium]|uniref:sensor histidine kinase n=1 Tax=Candidatus Pollutiaquabacter sp. TaxID=3416354 RepID=UPI001B705E78|nr:HAMP domain-containing histidine kinase [Bacteroidota bacterium]MBP7268923.1 HAMP domain-containing histidine kinase [Bacteroidia bacterium]MBP7436272.1 HAMP domain-containing histidine kinase [Bacteroidia bacterium]MBP7727769.1 HAMP domain-containing histidine kinase [Bacteroidia bacterium]MBP7771889.1 HAMP domain-containing histidine kinase [Bacteroidia bacterium]